MKTALASLVACLCVLGLVGCGGNSPTSTYTPPPPAVSITISAATATVQTTGYHDAGANQFQFTAAVQNSTNTSVTWDVNGQAADFDGQYGKISSSGLYTAPMLLPAEPIRVRATANADTTKTASAAITLQWAAQLYNLQVASSVETAGSAPIQLFFDTYGPRDVTWSVNGAEMGTPSGGAIALDYTRVSGNYIAPATIPAAPVHLAATLKSNGKSLSKDVTIIGNSDPNAPTVVVTPSSATLEPGATQVFSAAVSFNGTPVVPPGVFWGAGTYGGSYGHVLTDGVVKPDGTYIAPFDPPDSRAVVVTAYYSSAATPKTAYAIVTLADPPVDPNTRLNGQYAFSFHDFQYMSSAFGTLVADGHGNLGGTIDVSTSAGSLTDQPFTGSYTAHADGRVLASITYRAPGNQALTQPISLMLVSDTRAYAVSSGPMGVFTGTVEKQDPAAFDTTALQGDYGFLLHGTNFGYVNQSQVSSAYAIGGILTLHPDLTVSGTTTYDDGAARDSNSTGSYNFNTTSGRGTLTLTTAGATSQFQFAVISSNRLLLAASDSVTPTSSGMILDGWAERRTVSPPLTLATLTGPFVFYLSGTQFLEVGHFSSDGNGGLSSGLLDMRDTSSSAQVSKLKWDVFTGTYDIAANNAPYNRGRLYFACPGTSTNSAMQQYATFYMIAPGKLILFMDSMTTSIFGEAFQESLSTGAPDDARYAVNFVGADWQNYGTGWTMPYALNGGTPWVGWLDTITLTKTEWEMSSSGALLNDVYSLFILPSGKDIRAYAIAPSKMILIELDMGYSSANQMIWMEEIQ